MRARFFEMSPAQIPEETEKDIVTKLIRVRAAGYSQRSIKEQFVAADISAVEKLVLMMGKKILQANQLGVDEGPENNKEMCSNFAKSVTYITQNPKYRSSFIAYAAQLMQYYTIICNETFMPGTSLEDFNLFLDENIKKFGNTSKNVFIVEYKLIKIHNELATVADAISGRQAPTKKLEEKFNALIENLNNLTVTVQSFKNNAPDNIFSHYLDYVINYTTAESLELTYNLLHDKTPGLSDEEAYRLSDAQQLFLLSAKSALTEIDNLSNSFAERSDRHIKGMEYSFGQKILYKLPVSDIHVVRDHLTLLTH